MDKKDIINYLTNAFINDYIYKYEFDNFCSMKDCYGYDSNDIKEEVRYILTKELDLIVDGNCNIITDINENDYNYKSVITNVYQELKNMKLYSYYD